MSDHYVAVVVTVPEEHFPDEDEIGLTAANFVCKKLEIHLTRSGHVIPKWIQGGCDEDWGVYFESTLNEIAYSYHISIFPGPVGTFQNQMMVQYYVKMPFFKRLFRKPTKLLPNDPMHQTMRRCGELFASSKMLTESQFKNEFG